MALTLIFLTGAQDSFDSGLEKARKNESTPEGEAYQRPLFGALGPPLAEAMRRCFAETKSPDDSPFTLLFLVRGDGSIEPVMARPETNIAMCVLPTIEGTSVPAPPLPDWWFFTDMTITP